MSPINQKLKWPIILLKDVVEHEGIDKERLISEIEKEKIRLYLHTAKKKPDIQFYCYRWREQASPFTPKEPVTIPDRQPRSRSMRNTTLIDREIYLEISHTDLEEILKIGRSYRTRFNYFLSICKEDDEYKYATLEARSSYSLGDILSLPSGRSKRPTNQPDRYEIIATKKSESGLQKEAPVEIIFSDLMITAPKLKMIIKKIKTKDKSQCNWLTQELKILLDASNKISSKLANSSGVSRQTQNIEIESWLSERLTSFSTDQITQCRLIATPDIFQREASSIKNKKNHPVTPEKTPCESTPLNIILEIAEKSWGMPAKEKRAFIKTQLTSENNSTFKEKKLKAAIKILNIQITNSRA